MRRVAAAALLAASVTGCSWGDSHPRRLDLVPAPPCPAGSQWPQTGDATWLRYRLAQARLLVVACTGSAYVVRLRDGPEVYVWAFGPVRGTRPVTAEARWVREIAGVRLHGNDIRAVWVADERYVWVQAGPTALKLPSIKALSSLVEATVR